MSYYSEVAIAVKKTDYDKVIEAAKVTPLIKDEVIRKDYLKFLNGNSITTSKQRDDVCIIHWNWVQWHKTFGEYTEKLLEPYEYDFVRIGEEYGDIVYESTDEPCIEPVSTIEEVL